MFVLGPSDALNGLASTTGVEFTALGDAVVSQADSFAKIAQLPVPTSAGVLIAATALTQTLVKYAVIANTNGTAVTVTLYIGGTTTANQIGQFVIPALGRAEHADDGWKVYDQNGYLQYAGNTGPSGTRGSLWYEGAGAPGTIAGQANGDFYLNTTNSDVWELVSGTWTNIGNIKGATGLTGPTGPTGPVATVTAGDTTIVIGGTTSNPTVARAALTGAVTTSANVATVITNANLTGPVTSAGNATAVTANAITNAMLATMAADTAKGSVAGGTPVDLTQAQLTAMLNPANTTLPGSQSAAQFITVGNTWYDVTNYGVSISNSGATNTTAMNTLVQTTAGGGARFFFPQTGANYPFNGAIVLSHNSQTFMGTGDFNSVLFQDSTTDDLFRIPDGINKPTFMDLGMWSTVTMTSGSAINCGTVSGTGVPQLSVYRVGFNNFGGTWFNCILLNGSRSGEVTTVSDCVMNSFTNYGIGQIGNTSTPSTTSAMYVSNTTMNGGITGTTGAVAGIFIQQSGALQMSNVDIISCANNVLVAPITSVSQVAASVYAENCYFDHSHGSCIKLAGSEPIVRCKFTSCSMTVCNDAGGNYSAFEINNTASNPPGDIDLINCSFQNTFNNTATTNGILVTTGANIKIIGNNINGWTNGIQVTPAAAGVTRVQILGNTIGPGTITASASATGILLNAGSAAYGSILIQGNMFPDTNAFQTRNTANITDSSTMGTGTAYTGTKSIQGNVGTIVTAPVANYAATTIPLTTPTNVDSRGGLYFPVGTRPCSGRVAVYASNAATIQTPTVKVVFGPLNTTADPTLVTWTAGTAGTAVLGSGQFVIDWELVTATSIFAHFQFTNGNNAATGIAAGALSVFIGTPSPGITVSTAAQNNWLGIYASSATASAITVRSVKYEVQSQ